METKKGIGIFENERFRVRAVMVDGDICFFVKDIADCLGEENAYNEMRQYADRVIINGLDNDCPNRTRLVINREKLHSFISQKETLIRKAFFDWITVEILYLLSEKDDSENEEPVRRIPGTCGTNEEIRQYIRMALEKERSGVAFPVRFSHVWHIAGIHLKKLISELLNSKNQQGELLYKKDEDYEEYTVKKETRYRLSVFCMVQLILSKDLEALEIYQEEISKPVHQDITHVETKWEVVPDEKVFPSQNTETASNKTNEVFNYNGTDITFQLGDGNVMVNATQMAKPFGKTPKDWLRTEQSERLVNAISGRIKRLPADLVTVTNGGNNYGTWMHEDVAMFFAQWLSPEFYLWCNDRIKELLKTGVAVAGGDDDSMILRAMEVLRKRVEEKQKQIELQKKELDEAHPKVEYYDAVLQSAATYTFTEIAKEFGMSVKVFTDKLHKRGIIFKQSGRWMLYAKYDGNGYTKVNTYLYRQKDGTTGTSTATVFTEAGRRFVHSLFNDKVLK